MTSYIYKKGGTFWYHPFYIIDHKRWLTYNIDKYATTHLLNNLAKRNLCSLLLTY